MQFHSYFFIFVFLPLALAGWYLLNRLKRFKTGTGISHRDVPVGFMPGTM